MSASPRHDSVSAQYRRVHCAADRARPFAFVRPQAEPRPLARAAWMLAGLLAGAVLLLLCFGVAAFATITGAVQ